MRKQCAPGSPFTPAESLGMRLRLRLDTVSMLLQAVGGCGVTVRLNCLFFMQGELRLTLPILQVL